MQLANDFFSQAVVVAKNVAGARAAPREARRRRWLSNCRASSRACRRWSLARRSAGRCNTESAAPTLPRCASIALRLGRSHGRGRESPTGQFRLDGAVAQGAHPDRSGSGPPAGPELAGAWPNVLNTVMTGTPITQVRDDIYLSRCRRPRPGRAADLAIDLARAAASAPERAHGAAEPGRELRIRAGISVDLAAPARADLDGAGRCRLRFDARSAVRTLAPAVEKLNESLPKGYRIDVGGTVEESAQSQASVFAMVPLMLFLMLAVPDGSVAQFQPPGSGLEHRSDGPHRDCRRAAHLRAAARLCRDPRHSGVASA